MSERTEVRPPAGETEGQKTTRATRCLDVKITADLAARARRHDHGVLVPVVHLDLDGLGGDGR